MLKNIGKEWREKKKNKILYLNIHIFEYKMSKCYPTPFPTANTDLGIPHTPFPSPSPTPSNLNTPSAPSPTCSGMYTCRPCQDPIFMLNLEETKFIHNILIAGSKKGLFNIEDFEMVGKLHKKFKKYLEPYI